MQITINSANIGTFICVVKFNIFSRQIIFDCSGTTYNGSGASLVQGISFSLIDQDGVLLLSINFTAPQLPTPATQNIYTYDASALNFAFLFQQYQIIAAIKDQNGSIYQTVPVYKKICQPNNFNESGTVDGMFQILPDCPNNSLTVKELTVLTYNNQQPSLVSKTGTLSYPTGTISPVSFSNTPFSNNVIYTGSYRINCSTLATYNLNDDVYVLVTYYTNNVFDITCASRMADLMCCITSVQETAIRHCEDALGENARNQLAEISIPLSLGLIKEINGQDASKEAKLIKDTLNCNCGNNAISQNELNPVNPSVYSIVIQGVGDVGVTATTVGSTKTYVISSNIYQVVKGDTGDLAFTITTDTSVTNTVKYKITFNYDTMAGYILTAIGNNNTLLTQLNSLITTAGGSIDLSSLNGECVIDLSSINYFLSLLTPSSAATVTSILIGTTVHTAPGGLLVNNVSGIESWLNGLSLGIFTASFSTGVSGSYLNILSVGNTNLLVNMVFNVSGTVTVLFQKTNKSLIAVLQAIIDYLCGITALQIALGVQLSLCTFDYNGNLIVTNYNTTQANFNAGVSNAICNLFNRIFSLTGVTCAKIQAVFSDNPNAVFNYSSDRYLSVVGGSCVSLTAKQQALAFIAAVNAYSDVKTAYCAIDCTVPGTCPEITSINSGIVSGNIGIYGVGLASVPASSQTVTVRYKLHSDPTYIVSTSNLLISPNGNVATTPPYQITGVTPGVLYDIFISNNCGGSGFVGQIQVPSSTVYSASYLLSSVIYSICGASPITLYSGAPFATGVTMYTDAGLTTPVTGSLFIAPVSGGNIYQINTSTGVVGSNTGNVCSAGTSGAYRLDTSVLTICSQGTTTLYTNGGFGLGQTVYIDSALSTPVTGYTYIEVVSTGVIYTINSSTGQVLTSTGSTCTGSNQVVIFNNTSSGTGNILAVTGISGFTLSGTLTPGNDQIGTHSAFTGGISVQVSAGSAATLCLYKNGVFTHLVNTTGAGTYVFTSDTYLSTDTITVIWSLAGC